MSESGPDTGASPTSFEADPPPANPAGQPNGADTQGATPPSDGQGSADALSGIEFEDKDLETWVKSKGFTSPEAIAKSAREAETAIRQKGIVGDLPGENATPDDLNAFYGRIGRPERPDGYAFKLPDGISDDFPYSEEGATDFRAIAHEAGLRPEQASKLHDWYVTKQNELFTNAKTAEANGSAETQAQTMQRLSAATKEMEAAFDGPVGSPTYNAHLEFSKRFFREHGDDDLRQEMLQIGALVKDEETGKTHIAAPKLFIALSKSARAQFQEDGFHGSDVLTMTNNPFMKGASYNVTQQHLLKAKDPERARRMAAAAGVPIRD